MKPGIQKIIEIIYDLLFIGKTAAKDIQITSDATAARNIKRAIAKKDLHRLRRLVTKNGIHVDPTDIWGIREIDGQPLILIKPQVLVNYRQLIKDNRRYKRAKGA